MNNFNFVFNLQFHVLDTSFKASQQCNRFQFSFLSCHVSTCDCKVWNKSYLRQHQIICCWLPIQSHSFIVLYQVILQTDFLQHVVMFMMFLVIFEPRQFQNHDFSGISWSATTGQSNEIWLTISQHVLHLNPTVSYDFVGSDNLQAGIGHYCLVLAKNSEIHRLLLNWVSCCNHFAEL